MLNPLLKLQMSLLSLNLRLRLRILARRKKKLAKTLNKALLKEFKHRCKTLEMRKFDYEVAKTLALEETKKLYLSGLTPRKRFNIPKFTNYNKLNMKKYGADKKFEYAYRIKIVEWTERICRRNSWITKQDFKDKGLTFNDMFKTLYQAAIDYSAVRIYYETIENEARAKAAVQ